MPHLSALSLALNRPGAVSLEQVVASLFANNEQGAWYDPSAANVTWRRNLLTRTEEFDNAAWTKTNLDTSGSWVNQAVAPDGTTTAEKLIETGDLSAQEHRLVVGPVTTLAPCVFSIYAKASERSRIVVRTLNSTNGRGFNLSDGTTFSVSSLGITDAAAYGIESVGNGWYRCWIAANMQGNQYMVVALHNGTSNSYVGNGTSGLFAWGAQLDKDAIAPSPYQRIVTPEITYLADVQSQPLLYTKAIGQEDNEPVTGVEQPVGLLIDRRLGGYSGTELIVNGNFANGTTGWSATNSTLSASNGVLTVTSTANFGIGASTGFATVVGRTYRAQVRLVSASAGARIRKTDSANDFNNSVVHLINGAGVNGKVYSAFFVATATTSYVMAITDTNPSTISIADVTVKEVNGNHAYQTGSTARPVLRARYNLLTYSEQFNTNWPTASGAVVTGNLAVAPDGTTTGDLLSIGNGVTNAPFLTHSVNPSVANDQTTRYTFSIYAKSVGAFEWLQVNLWNGGVGAWFNTKTGQVGASNNAPFLISKTAQDVGNGWYRFVLTVVFPSYITACNPYIYIRGADNSTANITGDGTSGLYLWGAQFVVGTSAGDYQRIEAAPTAGGGAVTYATTSTITGQPFRPYLLFDGSDDVMIAPMDAADWINCTIASGLKFNFLGGTNQCPACVANSATGNSFAYIKDASNVLAWGMTIRNDGAVNGGAEVFANSNLLPHILYGASSPSAVSIECDNSVSTGGTTISGPTTANRIGLGALTRNSIAAYANHNMYGTIFVRRVLTAAERVSVRNYLADKTGVTL